MASCLIPKISGAVDFFQSLPRRKKSKFDSIQPPTAQALGGSGFSCGSFPCKARPASLWRLASCSFAGLDVPLLATKVFLLTRCKEKYFCFGRDTKVLPQRASNRAPLVIGAAKKLLGKGWVRILKWKQRGKTC